MTKKSKQVYNWLLGKTGYIKRKPGDVMIACAVDIGLIPISDIHAGLKEARAFIKAKITPKTPKVKVDNTIKFKKTEGSAIINPTISLAENKHRLTPGTYYITGCAHAPWQNKFMYDSVFNYLKREIDLEGIILAGDVVDLNSLSSHDKGKTAIPGVDLSWEYEEANKFLDQFDELKVKGTKDYIFGNHEDRYARVKKDSDVAKYGGALVSPTVGLNLIGRGYNVYEDWKNDSIHLGHHLDVCHGEFLNIHSAKKTIDTYRKSTVYFHTHRFQIYVEGLVGGFNMGFGGDINAPIFGFATRAMKNSWVNSSCVVTIDKDGFYHIEPLMFINNKLIVSGKEY